MSEVRTDPNRNELLERIARLEQNNARMERELNKTAATLADLEKAFSNELDSAVKHHKWLIQQNDDLYDMLWPVVHKVFPDYFSDIGHIAKITKRQKPPDEEKQP